MNGVNKAILVGHIGKDPEIRTAPSGIKVATFSLATGQSWRDKASGERKERTEWHRVVIFNEALVKIAEQYLRKGSKVYIEGELRTRKWTAKTGEDHWSTEIVLAAFGAQLAMLDRKEGVPPASDEAEYGTTKTTSASEPRPTLKQEMDDEIPF